MTTPKKLRVRVNSVSSVDQDNGNVYLAIGIIIPKSDMTRENFSKVSALTFLKACAHVDISVPGIVDPIPAWEDAP